ncbi:hypothetical protein [Nodularia chucula]|uniref:hypothetical protein n=1 Tax=Nodularia chucula TaxID=3093667 RepID=UPI0039C60C16
MKRLMNWLNKIRPVKILTVCLAATFLLMIQACNPGIAQQPPQPNAQSPNMEMYDPTKSYPLNTPEGGMNNFSDVDPRARADERAANARAAELAKNARKNVAQKGIDSSEQYIRNYQEGTPLDERVKRLGENIGGSAEELSEGFTKGTQRGVKNLQENIGGSAEELREGFTKGTQRGVKNLQENTGRVAKDLSKNVQRGTEDATKSLQRQAEDAADAMKRTVRDIDLD